MTRYYVELSYNGATRTDYDVMWDELKKSARKIADAPEMIIKEARRLGAPESCESGCCKLDNYADNYVGKFGENGHPVMIYDKGDEKYIAQHASTDDDIKYHVRRAYIRLLIEDCHRKCIEVNLKVV